MRLKIAFDILQIIKLTRSAETPVLKHEAIVQALDSIQSFWKQYVFDRKGPTYSLKSKFRYLVNNTSPQVDRFILGYTIAHLQAWNNFYTDDVAKKLTDATKTYFERVQNFRKELDFFTTWYETCDYD
jgi:hypothetical protein